jgi:phosphoribosylformimino-5-aminoimidazole carboxamide ribotide isomerase
MIFYPNSDYVREMQLILAMDLKSGTVMHGSRGERASYRPLVWGAAPSAVPDSFISHIRPRFLYIADLDRIEGTGDNIREIIACSRLVEQCYVDRGSRSPSDLLTLDRVVNVIGTETGGKDLSAYTGGYLSLDVKDGRIIPTGEDPVRFLESVGKMEFNGCILLNISAVGTGSGLGGERLGELRRAYRKPLFYGGGVATMHDIEALTHAGFDGAIIATGLHTGAIPLEAIRRGSVC